MTIRFVHILLVTIIAAAAFVAGIATRPWSGSAAPGDISACVNNYTGAVRMKPYGPTTCSSGETKVSWSALDTDTNTHGVGELETFVESPPVGIPALGELFHDTKCPEGLVAVSGGFGKSFSEDPDFIVRTSAPHFLADRWIFRIYNPNTDSTSVSFSTRCATP